MNNAYEAYASNPRYTEGGLEVAIEREEMDEARKMDMQSAAQADLEAIAPPKEQESDLYGNIRSIAETAIRVPQNVAAGMSGAIENTLALAVGRENINQANDWMREEMPDWFNAMTEQLQPKGTVDEVSQELTKFIVPFGLVMKGAKAAAVAAGTETGIATNALIAEVVTSGAALDPHMQRLSSFAKELGVENQLIDWLADNENETESEGRIKNIIEGVGITGAIATAFKSAAMTFKGLMRFKEFGAANLKKAGSVPVSGSPRAQRGSVGDQDYKIAHTAPVKEGSNTLDDLSDIMPDDFYDPSVSWNYYGHGGDSVALDKQTARIVSKFKGKPDADISIYRAVPKGVKEINEGDWVTVNKNYAKEHGSRHIEGGYEVIEKKVKASEVATDGNSIHEYGYSPNKKAAKPKPKKPNTDDELDKRMDTIIDELKNL